MADDDGGGTADDGVEAARERVIRAMERSADLWGLNRSYGRLYGVLYFADEPQSLDELVEASGYAKSTVSNAMRAMERLHFATRRSVPGEGKKVFYEAERNLWHVAQEFLRHEVVREIRIMSRALEQAEAALEGAGTEAAERDLEKIRRLQALYDGVERVVEALNGAPRERVEHWLGSLLE